MALLQWWLVYLMASYCEEAVHPLMLAFLNVHNKPLKKMQHEMPCH